jgi:hypothetical protein
MKIDNPEGVNLQRLIELEAQVMRPAARITHLSLGSPRPSFDAANFDVLCEFVVAVNSHKELEQHIVWSGCLRVGNGEMRADLYAGTYRLDAEGAYKLFARKVCGLPVPMGGCQ